MKYYVCLAFNKNDPTDILGLCEHSFCMTWEKGFCNLFGEFRCTREKWKTHKDYLNYTITYDRCYTKKQKEQKLKDTWKRITDPNNHDYHTNGRTPNEVAWQWANHYLRTCKPPANYIGKVFRVNSKYCPVKIDLTTRIGMKNHKIPIKKYYYRNAKFSLK